MGYDRVGENTKHPRSQSVSSCGIQPPNSAAYPDMEKLRS